jgi:hypothetical protein
MKRLVFVFSLALLIGLFALPGSVMLSYGASNSSDQGQVAAPEAQGQVAAPEAQGQVAAPEAHGQMAAPDSNQGKVRAPEAQEQVTAPKAKGQVKAKTHRKATSHKRSYRDDRYYDRSYTRDPRGYYDPYYDDYHYRRGYYYGPGISIDVPFVGIRIF